jgi:uncharacterized damage-inducible protein DinB
MRKTIAVAVLAMGTALGSSMSVQAQGGGMGAKPVASPVSYAEANQLYLNTLESEFVSAAKAMPADKYNFSPASLNISGAKYDGVRTFAEEVKHVTQANYYFYGAVGGMKPDVDVRAIGSLKSKDEIVSALEASFVFAHKALGNLTPATAGDPLDIDGLKSKGTVAAFAVAHGFDHYGQMVEYLRMNGIVPPASAK